MKIGNKIDKRSLIVFIVLLGIVLLSLFSYIINMNDKPNSEYECVVDSDCVKSSCCHADSCVTLEDAPDCSDVFCSQECSGPLDCGAGYCGCVDNKCGVVSNG